MGELEERVRAAIDGALLGEIVDVDKPYDVARLTGFDDPDATLRAAEAAVDVVLNPPCIEGFEHEWRTVDDPVQLWSGIRNTTDGPQRYSWWRVVDVCQHCGNPRVSDVEREGY